VSLCASPIPKAKGYNNSAWVASNFGFEIQIDERGIPDGAGKHKTGAVYGEDNQTLTQTPAKPLGQWNQFEVRVKGQTYTVLLNGSQVSKLYQYSTEPGISQHPQSSQLYRTPTSHGPGGF